MRRTLPGIALATRVALSSSLRAENLPVANGATTQNGHDPRATVETLKAGLPPLVYEDVRMIGALAEHFAAAEAERLMNGGLSLVSGSRGSGRAKKHAMRPTLPMIALATGAALCTAVLALQSNPRRYRGLIGRSGARPTRKAPPVSLRSAASPAATR